MRGSHLLSTLAVLSAVAAGAVWVVPALSAAAASHRIEQGTLAISNSVAGPILSLDRLEIGAVRTGSVTIGNTGSLAGSYTLAQTAKGGIALLRQLRVTIVGSGPGARIVYAGRLASLRRLELGRFAAGEARTYTFRVTLPSTGSVAGDNALQGLAGSLRFAWTAVPRS